MPASRIFGCASKFRQAAAAAILTFTQGPSFQVSSFSQPAFCGVSSKHWNPSCSLVVRGGGSARGVNSKLEMVSPTEAMPGADTSALTSSEKLSLLRERMKDLEIDVFVVPSDDPHLSEYVPEAYMRRRFLSDFAGSAGTAVVTMNDAFLWTDSRYWNEASMSLDQSCWTLKKAGLPDTPTIPKFLGSLAASKPIVVGIDPFVHPASFVKELNQAFDEIKGTNGDGDHGPPGTIKTLDANPVDELWGNARPETPHNPFRVHPLEYAGYSINEKVEKVREAMKEKKATLAVFSALDDVAYLLNIRCKGDIDTCPVGIAYATVSTDEVCLYCDPRKVESSAIASHLEGVTIKAYESIVPDVESHCEESAGNKVWIDTTRSNYALSSVVPEQALVNSQNAITPMKAAKNKSELKGMREAHVYDGAAMAKFMAEMVELVQRQKKSISEVEIDNVLTGYRAEQPGFIECSFPTIAGVGPNAAIVHYRAKEGDSMKFLDDRSPILIDSGGQYVCGTTDVTRTWHFGEASDEFRDCYTRVLKGNIAVDNMVFPEDTKGFVLDAFARQALWQVGKDYGHGTGHGVGAALNVHEGPMSISPRFANLEGLKCGMVVSNEPGYYKDGSYGIRIENLLEIEYAEDFGDVNSGGKRFLSFRKLTMIPIQKNLIKKELMTKTELDWLDDYHAVVFEKVSPLLEPDSPAMAWLEEACKPLNR